MTNEIYKIGETVWVGQWESRKERVPCPICFGTKVVTLILGDGTAVELDCKYCDNGFMGPQGHVVESHYVAGEVTQKVITGVDVRTNEDGIDVTYWFGGNGKNGNFVSKDKDIALAKATTSAEEQNEKQRTMKDGQKKNDRKSYSWNAGYYLREAAKSRAAATRYEEQARIMESKVRKPKEV